MTREEIEEAIREDKKKFQAANETLSADLETIKKIQNQLGTTRTYLYSVGTALLNCASNYEKGIVITEESEKVKIQDKIREKVHFVEQLIEKVSYLMFYDLKPIISNIESQIEANINEITTCEAYLTNHIIPTEYESYYENPYIKE